MERALLSILCYPPFSFFYTIPEPAQTRTRPMQVLALGLSRCGTESLKTALEELGYENVYHGYQLTGSQSVSWCKLWDRKLKADSIERTDFDQIIGNFEAVTDTPCWMFAEEMIRAYPEAKVEKQFCSSHLSSVVT